MNKKGSILENAVERWYRFKDEIGKPKIIRCEFANLLFHPHLYSCQYNGSCDQKREFGTQILCKKELYRQSESTYKG